MYKRNFVARCYVILSDCFFYALAPWANGGMGIIGDTRSVSGLHEGSLSVIGDGGQGIG